mmetsp:Transcript_27824/g.32940  ORF Transcript_27824/g.32940 Transcript_27824/m.32940 type:complete len:84 (-) Transcript_27824:354-605(-)
MIRNTYTRTAKSSKSADTMTTEDLSHTTTAHKKSATKTTIDFSTPTPTEFKLRFPQFAHKPKENTATDDDNNDNPHMKVSYLC